MTVWNPNLARGVTARNVAAPDTSTRPTHHQTKTGFDVPTSLGQRRDTGGSKGIQAPSDFSQTTVSFSRRNDRPRRWRRHRYHECRRRCNRCRGRNRGWSRSWCSGFQMVSEFLECTARIPCDARFGKHLHGFVGRIACIVHARAVLSINDMAAVWRFVICLGVCFTLVCQDDIGWRRGWRRSWRRSCFELVQLGSTGSQYICTSFRAP